MNKPKIRSKTKEAIIQSLRAGVTPKVGIQHIQVGRAPEIEALVKDIENIVSGGCAFRLIIGEYGSGKSFFLTVVRSIALEKKLVTLHADLSPDKRLQATGGQARGLYSELMKNISTRGQPNGNAMTSIVERFIGLARSEAKEKDVSVESIISDRLSHLTDLVGGYDFASVIESYWKGFDTDNESLQISAIRWLRAEYSTKTEARQDLGVRTIINDSNFYEGLKLMSLFVRQAGFKGLLVNLDEMVNLYKISNTRSRVANYEQILRMYNDCLQGSASSIAFLLGGTPEFLLDPHRGLYSYEALQSRLNENRFAAQVGVVDYSAPALHLANLSKEEVFILLKNIRHVFALGNEDDYLVPDEALLSFLEHCHSKIGDAYFKTPRNMIKEFVNMLTVLEQNSQIKWSDLVQQASIEKEVVSSMPSVTNSDNSSGLAEFKIN